MSQRVIIIEDEPTLSFVLKTMLNHHGYEVQSFADGDSALATMSQFNPDLFIVDLMLPDMSGIEVIKQVRQEKSFSKSPILVLTAKTEMADKLQAFSVGANDYMVKPFEPLELVYRVRSLLNLSGTTSQKPELIKIGAVTLDTGTFIATVDGKEVQLGKREAAVLKFLMKNKEAVHPAEEIATVVLGPISNSGSRTVDAAQTHIRNLRHKLEADPSNPTLIVTVGRKGYRYIG